MNTGCQNMIVMCAKTHLQCSHATFDGNCNMAKCGNEAIPTFRQMGELYLSVKKNISRTSRNIIIPILKRLAETIGMNLDSKVMLGINEWELIYRRLSEGTHPLAHEGGYDPATINMWFSVFTRCAGIGNRAIRLEYVKRGLARPDCDYIPDVDFSGKSRKIEELSPEQVDVIMDKMAELRNSKRDVDNRRFIWMWLALFFGVRPTDICKMKWECIKDDPCGGKRIEYVPGKTDAKTGGRPVAGHIHPKLYRWISPFIMDGDEYMIPRRPQHAKTGVVKHGEYVGKHASLNMWVNRFMRKNVKVKGHMAGYLMRRDCSKWVLEHLGSLAETILLGHSESTRNRNYVNLENVDARRLK